MRASFIHLTVDAIVLGYQSNTISILLVKRKNDPFKNQWALPGGFVEKNESLMEAAKRELKEETALEVSKLEQFHSFDDPDRDPRGRMISVAHYGFVHLKLHSIIAADDAKEVQWFNLNDLPELAFDHKLIIESALNYIYNKRVCEPNNLLWVDTMASFTKTESDMVNSILDKIEMR